jgi:hypothetical protein
LAKTAPRLVIVMQPDVLFSCRVTFDAISRVTRFAFGVHGFVLVLVLLLVLDSGHAD